MANKWHRNLAVFLAAGPHLPGHASWAKLWIGVCFALLFMRLAFGLGINRCRSSTQILSSIFAHNFRGKRVRLCLFGWKNKHLTFYIVCLEWYNTVGRKEPIFYSKFSYCKRLLLLDALKQTFWADNRKSIQNKYA